MVDWKIFYEFTLCFSRHLKIRLLYISVDLRSVSWFNHHPITLDTCAACARPPCKVRKVLRGHVETVTFRLHRWRKRSGWSFQHQISKVQAMIYFSVEWVQLGFWNIHNWLVVGTFFILRLSYSEGLPAESPGVPLPQLNVVGLPTFVNWIVESWVCHIKKDKKAKLCCSQDVVYENISRYHPMNDTSFVGEKRKPPKIRHGGHGVLENGPWISVIFLIKPSFSSGIFQPTMFDDTRG